MASGAKAVPSERAGEELVRRGHFGWVRTPVEYDGDAGGELRQYLPARAAGRPRRVERAGYGDPAEIRCAIRSGEGEGDALGAEAARPVRMLDVAAGDPAAVGRLDHAADGEAGLRHVRPPCDLRGQRRGRLVVEVGCGEERVEAAGGRGEGPRAGSDERVWGNVL